MDPEHPHTPVLGFRTVMVLYAVLLISAMLTLSGTPLYLVLVIVGGIALKTWLRHLRDRLDRS